jgi:hypothetical protein
VAVIVVLRETRDRNQDARVLPSIQKSDRTVFQIHRTSNVDHLEEPGMSFARTVRLETLMVHVVPVGMVYQRIGMARRKIDRFTLRRVND